MARPRSGIPTTLRSSPGFVATQPGVERKGATLPYTSVNGHMFDQDAAELLRRLASGMSLGEAAMALHLSRRTADRRLAAARRQLRVETTAEALVAFAASGA